MPLILDVLPVPGTTQFEAVIVDVPKDADAISAGVTEWTGIFDTEEEARMAGQEGLEELEELKAESE